MYPLPTLSAEERQFVEAVGVSVEGFGLPRIGGRLLGLMVIAPRPLALEEIAKLLKVSRASVSINTRILIAGGVLKPHAFEGDRRRFYTMETDFFAHRIQLLDRYLTHMQRLAAEGLAAVAPDNVAARRRLQAANVFATFLGAQVHAILPQVRDLFASISSHPTDPPGAD